MNEIELIRRQLATERAHALEVSGACAAALGEGAAQALNGAQLEAFRKAAEDYLECALSSFARRDQRLAELVRRLPNGDERRRGMDAALAQYGGSRDALARLGTRSWRELADYLGRPWGSRCETIDRLLGAGAAVGDWREFAGIDADSILEERTRYARVRVALPAGLTLAAPTGRQWP